MANSWLIAARVAVNESHQYGGILPFNDAVYAPQRQENCSKSKHTL